MCLSQLVNGESVSVCGCFSRKLEALELQKVMMNLISTFHLLGF